LKVEDLCAGDELIYCGELIIMRDAAQKRLCEALDKGNVLPVSLKDKVIFYAGSAKPTEGSFGDIGPTTSARMDPFLEMLYRLGVKATIGKGKRGRLAVDLCREYRRAYLLAPSGAAAALAERVVSLEPIAYEDLGTEAIFLAEVKEFPLYVAIDVSGSNVFDLHIDRG